MKKSPVPERPLMLVSKTPGLSEVADRCVIRMGTLLANEDLSRYWGGSMRKYEEKRLADDNAGRSKSCEA